MPKCMGGSRPRLKPRCVTPKHLPPTCFGSRHVTFPGELPFAWFLTWAAIKFPVTPWYSLLCWGNGQGHGDQVLPPSVLSPNPCLSQAVSPDRARSHSKRGTSDANCSSPPPKCSFPQLFTSLRKLTSN